jgi:exodeoxyribonuclease V alpha subunit
MPGHSIGLGGTERDIGVARVQVLSPLRKGLAGVQSLNTRLQALLNPPQAGRAEISLGSLDQPQVLRVGDRVIQVRSWPDRNGP